MQSDLPPQFMLGLNLIRAKGLQGRRLQGRQSGKHPKSSLGQRELAMKRAILAIAVVLAFTGLGNATSFLDGEKLHQMCQRYPEWTAGYVAGVIDTYWGAQRVAAETREKDLPVEGFHLVAEAVCLPGNVSDATVGDIVCQFLAENPTYQQYSGHAIVWTAITKAYGMDCMP